jgi:hypothetical protein
MNAKNKSILIAAIVASLGAVNAHAIQKHDPIFQNAHATISQDNDPDLVHQIRSQTGSPREKVDLYVAHPMHGAAERDLAREIRYQNGAPRARHDQTFELAPLR